MGWKIRSHEIRHPDLSSHLFSQGEGAVGGSCVCDTRYNLQTRSSSFRQANTVCRTTIFFWS